MNADAQIRAFVDRVLRLKEEQDALAADIREVYAEAKSMGFDKTALGGVVAHLRRVEKNGASQVEEAETVFDLYLSAYERASGAETSRTHAHARTRETDTLHSSALATTPADEQAGARIPLGAPATLSDPRPTSSPEADKAGDVPPPASPANPIPDFVPAFLASDKAKPRPLRPHCLNPETCAGQGNRHCHSCERAAAAQGVAA